VMFMPCIRASTGVHFASFRALPRCGSGPSVMGAARPLPDRGLRHTASIEPRPAHRPKPLAHSIHHEELLTGSDGQTHAKNRNSMAKG
jgi:hypothetical protein